MVTKIHLNEEDMEQVMNALPTKLKKKLKESLKNQMPPSGIETVKEFVDQFEEDDRIDHMISFTCASIICNVSNLIRKTLVEFKKRGQPGLSGKDCAFIMIKCLDDESTKIKKAFDDHDKECPNH